LHASEPYHKCFKICDPLSGVQIGPDEVEGGGDVGVSDSSRLWLFALGDAVRERKDVEISPMCLSANSAKKAAKAA